MEDEFYIRFEDKYRGSRGLIKGRLMVYLPIIDPLKTIYPDIPAIDLGCGRGEWLELLQESGWQAVGVDTNKSMIDYCEKLGLKVAKEDAIAYLRSVKSESVSVVSGFHIAEHLPFESLQELVKEAYRTLLPGGFLILETPNPENIMVGTASFYIDPTHLHPLPAQLLSFLPEYYGFYRTKILRLQEPPELTSGNTADLLNVLADVSPDYAIVAQKSAQPETLAVFDDKLINEHGLTLETLAQRYDSQVEATTQHLSIELGDIQTNINGIRTDLNKLGPLQDNLQTNIIGARTDLQGLKVNLEKVLAEQDKLQTGVDTELGDIQTNLHGIRTDLNKLGPVQDKLQADLNDVRVDLHGLRVDLENVRTERDGLQKKLEEAQLDHEAIQAQLTQAQSDRDGILAQLIQAQSDREAVQAELRHVYNSRSYRITAPLRAVFGFGRIWRDKILNPKKGRNLDPEQATFKVKNAVSLAPDSVASIQPIVRDQSPSIEKVISEAIQNEQSTRQSQYPPEMNLDEIMEKIREEVARSKVQTQHIDNFASSNVIETRLFRFVKKIQLFLKKLPFYEQINSIALKFKTHIPKYQQQRLTVTDLLKYNDEEFIKNAYKTILDREPDTDGFNNFLSFLRTGALSKTEILGRLRYSPEGRQTRVRIKGLLIKYFTSTILRNDRG